MKRIGEIILDDEDYNLLSRHKWTSSKVGLTKYAYTTVNRATVAIHRLIMGKTGNNQVIDHINGNGLDNRKINLRMVHSSVNCQNRKAISKLKLSKFRGVGCDRKNPNRRAIWSAKIKWMYQAVHMGTYKNQIDAAWAYDFAALLLFGENAATNFKHKATWKAEGE